MLSWADVGAVALRVALPVAFWGAAASGYAAARRDARWLASARAAALLAFALASLAALAMVGALLGHDFRVRYVAQNNALETPVLFTVTSLWAALEGSILLWAAILAGVTAWVAWRGTGEMPRLASAALVVLFGTLAFFLALMVSPAADPFVPLPPDAVPANGRGPNPLLQNHFLMAAHPPLLYLGYVLATIPFAYAIAALALGELGDRWLVATRRAALASWALLGLGLALGGWWGYGVLGWGGYWAWDPVENAALMPWLTATAYLHSVMVEEKRQLLRVWNLSLVIATFLLTIFGTFLTRSGVVNSVHSFTQSAIGPLLLGYLAAVLALSVGLLLWRAPRLADRGNVGAPLSREAVFLFQNVLFVAFTFTVLLGTLYPLVGEVASGAQLSIGAPYFDRIGIPIAIALLFLMGVGPQLPWRGASRATLERQFLAPVLAAAAGALAGLQTGGGSVAEVVVYALGAFVTMTVVQEVLRGTRARTILHGERAPLATLNLFRRNGRRYGGYIVHLGVVLIAIAIAVSQARTIQVERTLGPGGAMEVGPYAVTLRTLGQVDEPQRYRIAAELEVSRNGSTDRVAPALVFYPFATQPIGAPGILPRPDADVYAILTAYDERAFAWASVRVKIIPLVSWLWVGWAIVGLGAIIAALPVARRRPVAVAGPAEAAAS